LGVMRRDRIARFYLNGGRRNRTPSEDDFALACKLAFYCRHDLPQMHRLFMGSALYRGKFDAPRKGGNYALRTLKAAIEATPQVWIRKKRQRPSVATGAKKGRKTLTRTAAILEAVMKEPTLSSAEIAVLVGATPKQVRDTVRYHGSRMAENACPLIHSKGITQESLRDSGSEMTNVAA